MKVEILFPTIERWHCIDWVLKNISLAEKPKNTTALVVITGGDKYASYVEGEFKKIMPTRIVRQEGEGIEHSDLREAYYENKTGVKVDIRQKKLKKVRDTYQLMVNNLDPTADYYWFIEDDTLFPLDVFPRYLNILAGLKGDIITGVSYYWHTLEKHCRNFWNLKATKVFGENDSCPETTFTLERMENISGVVRLGASGLGNVLAKRDAVLSWKPVSYHNIYSGADISFYYNAMLKGFAAYGVANIYLPHITKYPNGDIEIRGRIDKSLLGVLG